MARIVCSQTNKVVVNRQNARKQAVSYLDSTDNNRIGVIITQTTRYMIMRITSYVIVCAVVVLTYMYLFPITYDQCLALRLPFTFNPIASRSTSAACYEKFVTKSNCTPRILVPSELKLLTGTANKYSDGSMFITFYNGNQNVSIASGKITVSDLARTITREYSFVRTIKSLTTELVEIRTIGDKPKDSDWTWNINEAIGCENE